MTNERERFEVEQDRKKAESAEFEAKREGASLEQLLGAVGYGWKVSISRMNPGWCKGWLETIEIDPDKPIDLEYIAETWGGASHALRILNQKGEFKAQRNIHIAQPPKSMGRRLEHPEDVRMRQERQAAAANPQPSQDSGLVRELIGALNGANTENLKLMRDMMINATGGGVNAGGGSVKELIGMAGALKDVGEMFAPPSGDGNGNEGNFMSAFTEMMKVANSKDDRRRARKVRGRHQTQDPRQGPPRPRQGPPQPRPQQGPPQPRPQQGPPQPRPQQGPPQHNPHAQRPPVQPVPDPHEPEEEITLAEELAELEPFEAAQTLAQALDIYPPEKRDQLMRIMNAGGVVPDDEDDLDPDDLSADFGMEPNAHGEDLEGMYEEEYATEGAGFEEDDPPFDPTGEP